MKKTPYTAIERGLSRKLFEAAKAAGRLKPPRGLFAGVTLSDGRTHASSRPATESDYLPDARQYLADPDSIPDPDAD